MKQKEIQEGKERKIFGTKEKRYKNTFIKLEQKIQGVEIKTDLVNSQIVK